MVTRSIPNFRSLCIGLFLLGAVAMTLPPISAEDKEESQEQDSAKLDFSGGGNLGVGGLVHSTGFTVLTLKATKPDETQLAVSAAHARNGAQQFKVVAESTDGQRHTPTSESTVSGTGRSVGVTTALCTFDLPQKSIAKLIVIRGLTGRN
jgi:hypothetical protein